MPGGAAVLQFPPQSAPPSENLLDLNKPGIKKFFEKLEKGDIVEKTWAEWKPDVFKSIEMALMHAGRHWLGTDNDRLVDIRLTNQEASKVLHTDNQMFPLENQLISRLVSRRTMPKCKPATQDESDIQRAKSIDKLFRWTEAVGDLQEKMARDAFNAIVTSRSYVIPLWNADYKYNAEEGEHFGRVEFNVAANPHVLRPIWCNDLADSPWVIWVRRYFKDKAERDFKTEFSPGRLTPFEYRADRYLLDQGQTESTNADTVLIAEIWIHPDNGAIPREEIPHGLRILWDIEGKRALEGSGEWPYPYSGFCEFADGKTANEAPYYPFFEFYYEKMEGTARTISAGEIIKDDQLALNRLITRIAASEAIACAPIMFVPDGTMKPGIDIRYKAGKIIRGDSKNYGEPKFLQPPTIGAAIIERQDRIKMSMREKLMVREVSLAAQGGATSGTMYTQMKATDNANSAPMYNRHDARQKRLYQTFVKMYKAFMPPRVMLSILGLKTGAQELDYINTMDIDLNADIQIETDDNGFLTPFEREQIHINRVANGAETPEDFAMAMDGRDPNERKFIDIKCSNAENELMLKGIPVDNRLVVKFQNDDVHLEQHRQYTASDAFYEYDPQVQQAFIAHSLTHEQSKQMKAQIAAQTGAAGQVAAGQGAPQPNAAPSSPRKAPASKSMAGPPPPTAGGMA